MALNLATDIPSKLIPTAETLLPKSKDTLSALAKEASEAYAASLGASPNKVSSLYDWLMAKANPIRHVVPENVLNAANLAAGKGKPSQLNTLISNAAKHDELYAAALDPSKTKTIADAFGAAKLAAKAHPLAATAMAGLATHNISGLLNDDKVAGQLLGGAGGALLGNLLGKSVPGAILAAGIGGSLGSLFDKHRAAKEDQMQNVKNNLQFQQYRM